MKYAVPNICAVLGINTRSSKTELDELQCIWRHCNIGSKRAFPTGVLGRWHNCLLIYLTHNLFSSCIRRYLVSRACDWVMPAISAVLLIFCPIQSDFLQYNITHWPHQHCGVLLVLIRSIGHKRCRHFGRYLFVPNIQPSGKSLSWF